MNKKYKRLCPSCHGEITYDLKARYLYGEEHNLKCKDCRGIRCKACNKRLAGTQSTGYCLDCYKKVYLPSIRAVDSYDSLSWHRECPSCGTVMNYTTSNGFRYGKERNSICAKCLLKKVRTEPRHCVGCNVIISHDNKSGNCRTCYLEKVRRESKTEKIYTCSKCNMVIRSIHKYVIRQNVERGCCYKCWKTEQPKKPTKMVSRTCIVCHKEYAVPSKSNRKTCNRTCLDEFRHRPKSTTSEFIQRSINVHGNIYDYSKVDYRGVLLKVTITCKKHGDFLQSPQEHLNGHGCSICYASHGERLIRRFFETNNILYKSQQKFDDCINPKTGRKLYYDFYIPDKNLLIEFDGTQHYKTHPYGHIGHHKLNIRDLENIQYRDSVKTIYALFKGIKLLRITDKQKEDIDAILRKEIYG